MDLRVAEQGLGLVSYGDISPPSPTPGVSKQGLKAKPGPPSLSAIRILLEHSQAYSFSHGV